MTRMTVLTLNVWGEPAPQGSKRHVGRGVMIESSKKVKPWREAVKFAALEATQAGGALTAHAGPMDGPVNVEVVFRFTRPKGHYRTGRNSHLLRTGAPRRPAGKPDLDKLLRSTFDALSDAGVWGDDAQVVTVTASKEYAAHPIVAGAVIRIQQDTDLLAGGDTARLPRREPSAGSPR